MTVALVALVLASIADVLTTRAGLRTGLLVERNPLMRWSTRTTRRALAVKLVGVALISAVIVAKNHAGLAWFGAAVYTYLAIRNFRLYRLVQRPE